MSAGAGPEIMRVEKGGERGQVRAVASSSRRGCVEC